MVDWGLGVPPMNRSLDGTMRMTSDDFLIETLSSGTEPHVSDLIRRNLLGYEEAGSVLASTFRRLNNLLDVYHREGASFFVLRHSSAVDSCIGAAGIGSLHGLSPSEGLGEVRDLVLEENYRGRGLGARLLKRCVEEAKALGYKRLYLETTPQMEKAQKLFIRFGFRPVTQAILDSSPKVIETMPCYFLLEDL